MIEHSIIPEGKRHGIANWEVLTAAARDALSVGITDVGKVCHVLGRGMFLLASVGPAVWERASEDVLIGNSGKRYKMLAFAIKKTSALGSWAFLGESDGGRAVIGASAVGVSGKNISITYGYTGSGGYIGCNVDDKFVAMGLRVGHSMGNTNCISYLYAQLSGPIYENGIRVTTALGQDVAQTVSQAAGTIVVTHGTVTHPENEGSAVIATAISADARFAITDETKTGFSLQYQKPCAGTVDLDGSGVVTMTSDLAYGTSKNVTAAVNNGSGDHRLTVTAHGIQASGMLVRFAGVGGVNAAVNGDHAVTVIDANTLDIAVAYTTAYTSGGTAIMLAGVWNSTYLTIYHPPVAAATVPVFLQKNGTGTRYHMAVTNRTAYSFDVYFYDTSGTAVTSPSANMDFLFSRPAFAAAPLPTGFCGNLYRDNVQCDAADIYDSAGSIYYWGLMEIDD